MLPLLALVLLLLLPRLEQLLRLLHLGLLVQLLLALVLLALVVQVLLHPLELLQHQPLASGHLVPLEQQQHPPLVLGPQGLPLEAALHQHLEQHQQQGLEEQLQQHQVGLVQPLLLELLVLPALVQVCLLPLLEQEHQDLEQQQQEEEHQHLGRVGLLLDLVQYQEEDLASMLGQGVLWAAKQQLVLLLLPLAALGSSSRMLEEQLGELVLGCSSRGVQGLHSGLRQARVDSKGLGKGRKGQHQGLGKERRLGLGRGHQQGLGVGHCLGREMVQGASVLEQQLLGLRGARLPHGGRAGSDSIGYLRWGAGTMLLPNREGSCRFVFFAVHDGGWLAELLVPLLHVLSWRVGGSTFTSSCKNANVLLGSQLRL